MTSTQQPLDGVVLDSALLTALEVGDVRRGDTALSSTTLLAAIVDSGPEGLWWPVQQKTQLVDRADARQFPDPSTEGAGFWHDVPLTAETVNGIAAAVSAAGIQGLARLSAPLLVWGLVSQPESGAARALLRGGSLTQRELVRVVAHDVVLPGIADPTDPMLDLLLLAESNASGRQSRSASPLPSTGSGGGALELLQRSTAGGGALELLQRSIATAGDDPDLRVMLDSMLLTVERVRVAALGTGTLADEPAADAIARARERFDVTNPDAPLLIAAAASRSPRVTEILRRLGITPTEVAAQMVEFRLRRDGDIDRSSVVWRTAVVRGLVAIATTILIISHALGDGSLWEILLLPTAWSGYPQSGPSVQFPLAAAYALLFNPLIGAFQLINAMLDVAQARAERTRTMTRTGYALSLVEQRHLAIRALNARGRRFQQRMQSAVAQMRALREDRDDLAA